EFAKSYEGDLMVISVVDVTDEFMAQAPGLVEEMVKKAKGIVESVKKKAEASNIKSENFVREGETYKVIVELAKKENADVIFMGSHGRTGPKRLLMGSVTERVIGHSPCPVLVVRS
ncbi:MAG: universal stress protein, partial [Nitrospirota bacterium]